jgi:antitoxin ParD1/3/4
MTYHTLSFPPALQAWVDARIAEGRYADVAEYVRDLVRRDQEAIVEERNWVRAMIQEGLDSGVLDQDAEEILDEIIAEDPDLRA